MSDDSQLLRQYTTSASQEAFAQLAERYVDVVYAAARRQVGDAHLAEDVTQAVFIVLAKRAKSVPMDRPLSAWLLTTTRYCAANARRARDRREHHERRAGPLDRPEQMDSSTENFKHLSPLLDEGIARLRSQDRDALLLRYFEKKSLRQVGDALGVSEEAAGKRVARAVEKLRNYFVVRGATVSAAALATLLTAESASAAPSGLALLAGTATAGSTGGSTLAGAAAKGAIAAMAIKKTAALAAVAAALLLGIGGGVWVIQSAFRPATARTVDVTNPSASPAAGAESSAWGATFSDGTILQMLGIAEIAASGDGTQGVSSGGARQPEPQSWWAPDGTPLTSVPTAGESTVSAGAGPGERPVRFVLSRRSPASAARDASVEVRIIEGAGAYATSSRRVAGETIINCATAIPVALDKVDVRLGLANGPWREDASATLGATPLSTTRASGAEIFGSVTEEDGQCVVEIDQNLMSTQDREIALMVVLKDGTTVRPSEWRSFPGGRGQLRFLRGRDRIESFVCRSRPYEWATLKGVSVRGAEGSATTRQASTETTP